MRGENTQMKQEWIDVLVDYGFFVKSNRFYRDNSKQKFMKIAPEEHIYPPTLENDDRWAWDWVDELGYKEEEFFCTLESLTDFLDERA